MNIWKRMPAVLFTLTISGTVSGLVHNIERIFSENQDLTQATILWLIQVDKWRLKQTWAWT